MATLVQSTQKVVTAVVNTTTTLAYASNLAAGNLIANSLATADGTAAPTIQTPTDTLSHTYAPMTAEQALTSGSFNLRLRSYYKENCSSGADTVTFDALDSGGDMTCVIAEFSGVVTASALDQTQLATGTSSSCDSGATSTTSQADELLWGAMTHDGATDPTITETGSASLVQEHEGGLSDMPIAVSYRIVAATGAYHATWTVGASVQWAGHIASFKLASSGPTITQHPAHHAVLLGRLAIFSVQATPSGGSLTYQWKVNGASVSGETNSTFSCIVTTDNSGAQVTCDVTDSNGTVTSNAASIAGLRDLFRAPLQRM